MQEEISILIKNKIKLLEDHTEKISSFIKSKIAKEPVQAYLDNFMNYLDYMGDFFIAPADKEKISGILRSFKEKIVSNEEIQQIVIEQYNKTLIPTKIRRVDEKIDKFLELLENKTRGIVIKKVAPETEEETEERERQERKIKRETRKREIRKRERRRIEYA